MEFCSLRLGRAFYLIDRLKYKRRRSNIFEELLPQLIELWLFLGYVYSSVLKYHFIEVYIHYLSEKLGLLPKIMHVPSYGILERCWTPHFYVSSSITTSFVCNHQWMWQTTLFRIHQNEELIPIHQSELMKKEYYYFYSNLMEMKHDNFWLEYTFHIWIFPHWPMRTYSEINTSDIKKTGILSIGATVKSDAHWCSCVLHC